MSEGSRVRVGGPAGTRRRLILVVTVLVVLAAYSGWVADTTPFTWGADVAVTVGYTVVAAIAVRALLLRHRVAGQVGPPAVSVLGPGAPTEQEQGSLAGWTLALGVVVVVELLSYFGGSSASRAQYPTLSYLYDSAVHASVAAKGALVGAWMALGWGLFRR